MRVRVLYPLMPPSRVFRIIGLTILALFLAACQLAEEQASVIGAAWAGPAELKLHKEIDPRSDVVATVVHGEKLAILTRRRAWYKVRTAKGIEGWTSDRQLLDEGQMARLRLLSDETSGLPSQNVASTFDSLNVHTEPSRQSPAFMQVREHEKVDVIAHRIAPRAADPPKRQLIKPVPKALPKKQTKEKGSKISPPPAPPTPAVPSNWLELSQPREEAEETQPAPQPAGPVAMDDWSLIRTSTGASGWVLTNGLYPLIPDEVAQYAEGHRITSYFSLGKIDDGGEKKDIWIWTTAQKLGEDHDFDSYRVFVWNVHRHRYETAYIQRRERGYFPVLAKPGQFSVCLENDDGSRTRKQFEMVGNAVHLAATEPCGKRGEQQATAKKTAPAPASNRNLVDRMKARAKGIFGSER